MSSELTLLIGTKRIGGWKSVEVIRSITQMASTFNLELTDVWDKEPTELVPELSVTVLVGEDTLITGFIDNMSIDARVDSYDISVSGRCRTGDLIDCSAINKPGTWKNIDLLRLAEDLVNPFGIKVIAETNLGEKIKEVSISTGETILDILNKVCKERAVLSLGNTNGNLLLTIAGNDASTDNLVYGGNEGNVLTANIISNYIERFSLYQVKGQRKSEGDSWGKTTTNIFGEANDLSVNRYRPKLFSADGITSNNSALKRASWEAQVRAGRSNTVKVSVIGWTQSNGELWRENRTVYAYLPPLRISAEMIIEEIVYSLSESGKIATMTLVSPDTYSSEPKKVIKKKNRTSKFGWW